MKRILTLITAVMFALIFLVSCGEKSDGTVPDGMKLASSEVASYKLYVPEDWVIDLQTGATSAHVSESDMSNISVIVWDLEHTDDTVETWWELNLEELNMYFTDFTEISTSECEMGGHAAKDYIYTAKAGGNEYQYRQVASVRNGAVYVLTYTSTPQGFENYLDEVESIIANIEF